MQPFLGVSGGQIHLLPQYFRAAASRHCLWSQFCLRWSAVKILLWQNDDGMFRQQEPFPHPSYICSLEPCFVVFLSAQVALLVASLLFSMDGRPRRKTMSSTEGIDVALLAPEDAPTNAFRPLRENDLTRDDFVELPPPPAGHTLTSVNEATVAVPLLSHAKRGRQRKKNRMPCCCASSSASSERTEPRRSKHGVGGADKKKFHSHCDMFTRQLSLPSSQCRNVTLPDNWLVSARDLAIATCPRG